MELPNLEGQPGWVVVVVVALVIVGGLGTLYLRKRFQHDRDEDEEPRVIEGQKVTIALPAGAGGETFDPVKEAMGMVAANAARYADDADRAEEEARMLTRQLADCERDRAVALERYAALEKECTRLQEALNDCRRHRGGAA